MVSHCRILLLSELLFCRLLFPFYMCLEVCPLNSSLILWQSTLLCQINLIRNGFFLQKSIWSMALLWLVGFSRGKALSIITPTPNAPLKGAMAVTIDLARAQWMWATKVMVFIIDSLQWMQQRSSAMSATWSSFFGHTNKGILLESQASMLMSSLLPATIPVVGKK